MFVWRFPIILCSLLIHDPLRSCQRQTEGWSKIKNKQSESLSSTSLKHPGNWPIRVRVVSEVTEVRGHWGQPTCEGAPMFDSTDLKYVKLHFSDCGAAGPGIRSRTLQTTSSTSGKPWRTMWAPQGPLKNQWNIFKDPWNNFKDFWRPGDSWEFPGIFSKTSWTS